MAVILLIDDEPDIRESVGKLLGRSGHSVHTSANAAEGLQFMENNSVDVVITDLVMPEMNGVKVTRFVRDTYPETRIIAISGGGNFGSAAYLPNAIATSAYLEAAADVGADFVLTKPFRSSELLDAVERVIDD